jgi:outer membrane protein OmpA-like peptidoglycan-associated protein
MLLTFLAGCAGKDGGKYTVFFMPYSSQLDQRAQDTIQAAATFAIANPLMPVTIQGYSTRPDPTEHDSLRELRTGAVKNGLLQAGVSSFRIQVLGVGGIIYPQGVPMPTLPPGQVDISVGL